MRFGQAAIAEGLAKSQALKEAKALKKFEAEEVAKAAAAAEAAEAEVGQRCIKYKYTADTAEVARAAARSLLLSCSCPVPWIACV